MTWQTWTCSVSGQSLNSAQKLFQSEVNEISLIIWSFNGAPNLLWFRLSQKVSVPQTHKLPTSQVPWQSGEEQIRCSSSCAAAVHASVPATTPVSNMPSHTQSLSRRMIKCSLGWFHPLASLISKLNHSTKWSFASTSAVSLFHIKYYLCTFCTTQIFVTV